MSNGRLVTTWDVGAPPDWACLPLAKGRRAAPQLAEEAARLTDDPASAEQLQKLLAKGLASVLEEHHILVAAWVPDRQAPVPEAILTVELLVDAEIGAYEQAVLASSTPHGVQRMKLEVHRTELPAGPGLVIAQLLASPFAVEQLLSLVVFIPGTADAISFDFCTSTLHLVDTMALAARDIVESLRVETGPTQAAP